MSNKPKKQNLVLDDKKVNYNLISIEKSPNYSNDNNINYAQRNNNNSNNINNNPKKKNDLLDIKNEDDLSISTINIEQTQKFQRNAEILFTDEDEKEEDKKENCYENMNNENKSNEQDISNEGISINEEKRIEYANNLFDKSLSCSINSNINEPSLSLIWEKRKDAADQLFQSVSDVSSKKRSLNETLKSNKSTKTNMSHVINNLSGSNIGLNINAIANKYANLDKVINESDADLSITNNQNDIKNSINIHKNDINSFNDYDNDIEEQNDEDIKFRKNLIDFKKMGNEISNKFNNLNSINCLNNQNKKDNNLITSVNKNDLMISSKERNTKIHMGRGSKKNILSHDNDNDNESNFNNLSNNEISIDKIEINNSSIKNHNNNKNIIKDKDKQIKGIKIDESIKKEDNAIKKIKNNNISKKTKFEELFKKNNNKHKKNEERKVEIIDKGDSEDDTSNDILNNHKKIRINSNEYNESSILNKDKENNELFISKSKDKNLISDKNSLLQGGGRSTLLSENDQNKIVKIKNRKKKEENDELYKDKENNIDNIESPRINIINNNKSINIDKNDIPLHNEKNLVYFNKKNFEKEKRFKDYLIDKNLYYKENIYNKEENEILLKTIRDNSYFNNYLLKKETIFDIINNKKKSKEAIPYHYEVIKNNYENNKQKFNLLFQFINNDDKEKLYKLYKKFQNYNIANYSISPYINDINNFYQTFKIKNNKTLDYIRYTIEQNSGDDFYRCFMFNLLEKYILSKKKENIFIIVFDIFKIYDLLPSIFTDNNKNINLNEILIIFSIFIDYIQINLWEKAYDLYLSFYTKISQVLIIYIKYNIFLYLSKIYSDNDNKEIYINYINQYKKIIFNYNDPTLDILQLIPYIYGVKLDLIYLENINEDEFEMKKISFDCGKIDKNNYEKINIIYFNNYYSIGYQKKDFESNSALNELIKKNINKISPIQYIKKDNDKIYCEVCEKNVDCVELISDNNKGICSQCLNTEIDEHLNKRISYINEDYKDNYIDYSYYLRPIELVLNEPLSIKDNIENNSIIIRSIDYYLLFEESFSQRISELFKKNTLKNSILNNNKEINDINNNINNIINNISTNNNDYNACSMCQKSDDILASSCGCKYCEDCLYELLVNITNNEMILNGYEKMQLLLNDSGKCPNCQKMLNLQYLTMLFEERGKEFGNEYNNAKKRMKNYCKTMCFICEKKFNNEKSLEVSHNSKKDLLQINVMINKHCIKKSKINEIINNDENDYEKENEIDYCDTPHIICFDCYKKNKGGKVKKIREIQYKVMMCNICGIQHYVSVKDWERWNKNDVCCKCEIF